MTTLRSFRPVLPAALVANFALAGFSPAQAQTQFPPPSFGVRVQDIFYTWGTEGSTSAEHSFSYSLEQSAGSASLAGGDIHAAVSVIGQRADSIGLRTTVTFWDTVTFHNGSDLSLVGSTELSIDGSMFWAPGGGASATLSYFYGDRPNAISDLGTKIKTQALGTGTTQVDNGLFIPIGDATYFIWCQLSVEASMRYAVGTAYSDFGHTLHFNWDLPEGVTYTSASGVFMSAVPEPHSYALMLAGLAGVGFVARRRSGAQGEAR